MTNADHVAVAASDRAKPPVVVCVVVIMARVAVETKRQVERRWGRGHLGRRHRTRDEGCDDKEDPMSV